MEGEGEGETSTASWLMRTLMLSVLIRPFHSVFAIAWTYYR